ncbi:hypothetical protein AB0D27_34950 [Streptomyces sp. NPDC048415]|uniref:hypothetical protein n=1 Tax=Streptomyces sp. NPDC048415 TaxID=3154822 RepID=UPI00343537A7
MTSDQVAWWGAELEDLGPKVAGFLERSEPGASAVAYVRGLLADVPRENGWQRAEQAGAATPWSTRRLLDRELCLPDEERVQDATRRTVAAVPTDVAFAPAPLLPPAGPLGDP